MKFDGELRITAGMFLFILVCEKITEVKKSCTNSTTSEQVVKRRILFQGMFCTSCCFLVNLLTPLNSFVERFSSDESPRRNFILALTDQFYETILQMVSDLPSCG